MYTANLHLLEDIFPLTILRESGGERERKREEGRKEKEKNGRG